MDALYSRRKSYLHCGTSTFYATVNIIRRVRTREVYNQEITRYLLSHRSKFRALFALIILLRYSKSPKVRINQKRGSTNVCIAQCICLAVSHPGVDYIMYCLGPFQIRTTKIHLQFYFQLYEHIFGKSSIKYA